MPSDSGHTIFNFIVYALISILLFKFPILSLIQYAVFTIFFIIGTLVLNPDLDTNSKGSKRCGIACRPYKWIFRHRGASHHWLWGTVARILYVAVLVFLILLAVWVFWWRFPIDGSSLFTFMSLHVIDIILGGLGLFIANLLHIILDHLA